MKYLAIGISTLALSSCGWMGTSYHSPQQHAGYYAPQSSQYAAPSRTHLELSVGATEFRGGNVLPTLNGPNGLATNKVSYRDAYKTGIRTSAGFSTDVAPRTTLLARGFYKKAEANDNIFDLGTQTGGGPRFGGFSDHQSYGGEIGFREYLSNEGRGLRPYIGATAGASYAEAIELVRVSADGNAAATATSRLYDGGWVPTASAVIGIDLPVSRNTSFGLESGLRYEGKRDLEIGNNLGKGDDNYSVPLKLRGRFRF